MVAAAVIGLWAAAGCSQQAAAIRVGDSHISYSEFTDQLETFRTIQEAAVEEAQGDPAVLDVLSGELAGSFSRTFATQTGETLLTQQVQARINALLVAQLFDDANLELTGQDREIARQQLGPAIPGFEEELEDHERDRIIEDESKFQALQREMCPGFVPTQTEPQCEDLVDAVDDLYKRSDLEVSSKLGTWEKGSAGVVSGRLIPPEGPESQPRDGDAPDPNGSPLSVPIG